MNASIGKDLSQVTHIIFDWDGTIMDSAAKIVSCMQKAAIFANLPVPSKAAVEHIIGISLLPAIEQLFEINQSKAKEVQAFYRDIFIEQDQSACRLFDGAHQVLDYLSKRYVLNVATGKARRGLQRALKTTSSTMYFSDTICADEAMSKPSPDMLLKLLERQQIQAHQAVMVGDTIYDMQMAQAIGMPRIGVSYGVHDKQQIKIHEPLHIIDDLAELSQIFKG